MNPPAQPDEPAPPGKIRTWWHPLLVNLLRWQLGEHYHLEEEVSVGQKPLQIDILLLRKEQGELSADARAILAGLVERLGILTLIEFKSPLDTLEASDLPKFLAYALLYRAQNDSVPEPAQMHLVVLAPRLTGPYREELQTLGIITLPDEPGVWRLQGGAAIFPMWVLETEVLTGLNHPLLTVFSAQLLRHPRLVYDNLTQAGYTEMAAYMFQQVHHFSKSGKEFVMQHLGFDEIVEEIVKDTPLDMRLRTMTTEQRLQGLSAEELLKRVSAEERVKGLSAEVLVKGLSPEELEKLRKLLQEGTNQRETCRRVE